MNFEFYFGPDKNPFTLTENGMVEHSLTMPFHGIISRGLLNKFIEYRLNIGAWYDSAPTLHNEIPSANADFVLIKSLAEECCVLSFAQSAFCAREYVKHYCGDKCKNTNEVRIWNIKEGHTSSVWKITLDSNENHESFVVNVSRDNESGIELKNLSEKLIRIGSEHPDLNLAKVYEIISIEDDTLPFKVLATRNEWIENSYEIHQRMDKTTEEAELLMVERFLTDKNNPAHIKSVLGRKFSDAEVIKIKNELNTFLTYATDCLPEKPEININDGDAVWNGERAVVVAIN